MANHEETNSLLGHQETRDDASDRESGPAIGTTPPPSGADEKGPAGWAAEGHPLRGEEVVVVVEPVPRAQWDSDLFFVVRAVPESIGEAARKEVDGGTAEGRPIAEGSVLGLPVARERWSTGLFALLGSWDGFCCDDLGNCILGCYAPYILYGSNIERLVSNSESYAREDDRIEASTQLFGQNCLLYAVAFYFGGAMFGCNLLAPCLSFRIRTAIRRRFNLEGSFEAFTKLFGCCSLVLDDELKREPIEAVCDFATHYFCYPFSICQEAREVARRFPRHKSDGTMMPPMEQKMDRIGA